jgi:hypothetical protein
VTARNTTTRDRDRKAIARTKAPCGICGGEIDYTLKSPAPDSFEVDHILAIANGGTDELSNKQAAHRRCNRAKWHNIAAPRRVVLVCGPAGAGKTTWARASGLAVYDLDDEQWNGEESRFRQALAELATDPHAQAAVIRSGASVAARQKAARLCGATEVVLIDTDRETCVERIKERRRLTTTIKSQIAAAYAWWHNYEPGDVELGPVTAVRSFVTTRTW